MNVRFAMCICLSINRALLFYVNFHCPLRAPDLDIKDIVLYCIV